MEKKQSSVDHIINWVTTNGLFSEDGKSITYSCAELELVIREALLITPIELPTDEEINENSKIHMVTHTGGIGFIQGAEWMRDKIKGGNNE
jgi:hypothetical protein